MPPKKKSEPSKKTVSKQKEKVIEDKTFGLKNKKGKKQQTFIKQVTQQVKHGGQSSQKLVADQHDAKKNKLIEQELKKDMDAMFRPAAGSQKISAGADPKSVLCVFYKQGMCTKGDKCKFSHDMELERKAEKKSMYVDSRDLEQDTIDNWDEDKLKEVVEQKHGGKVKPKTDIVCKFFLKAIEDAKYGWFWECPNGGDCMYRHALPPGFVFKTKKKPDEATEGSKISLEQLVEEEREKLLSSGNTLTKVTLDSFLAWKRRKLKEKQVFANEQAQKRKDAFQAGKTVGISGREMFEFNPNLIQEDDSDDEDGETVYYARRQEDDNDDNNDNNSSGQLLMDVTNFTTTEGGVTGAESRLQEHDDDDGPSGAVGGVGISDQSNGVEIDENLFSGDIVVDESLFDVDEDELGLEDDDDDDEGDEQ